MSSDKDAKMEESDDESMNNEEELIDEKNLLRYKIRIPFPKEHWATSAMNSLGVDAPF